MSTTTATQLIVDRSSAQELLKINFNVRRAEHDQTRHPTSTSNPTLTLHPHHTTASLP